MFIPLRTCIEFKISKLEPNVKEWNAMFPQTLCGNSASCCLCSTSQGRPCNSKGETLSSGQGNYSGHNTRVSKETRLKGFEKKAVLHQYHSRKGLHCDGTQPHATHLLIHWHNGKFPSRFTAIADAQWHVSRMLQGCCGYCSCLSIFPNRICSGLGLICRNLTLAWTSEWVFPGAGLARKGQCYLGRNALLFLF